MVVTKAMTARFVAEDNYRRAQSSADVCARVIADTMRTRPDTPIPAGFLFRYAQFCEAEQRAYEAMVAAQKAAVGS